MRTIKKSVKVLHSFLQCLANAGTLPVQYRGMEQLAAREVHSLKVGGSSPSPATKP